MSDYYDIHSILAEDERVPATFQTGATGVGRALDPSCDDDNLKEGASVELPLWLASPLIPRNMITIREPKFYGDRIRREIQADAACVNLRECSSYYYELGSKLTTLISDRTLGGHLLKSFQGRYKEILTRAHSCSDQELTRHRRILTKEEAQIMEAGRKSTIEFSEWLQRSHQTLKMAPILCKHRRKREPLTILDGNASDRSKRTVSAAYG